MPPDTRPVLNISYSSVERTLEVASAAGVAFGLLIIVQSWSILPPFVPSHFGFSGRPDAWSDRRLIFLYPILSVVLYIGLTVLSRYPHRFNYPWPITEQNAQRQYQISRSLLCWMKAEVVCLLVFLEWKTVQIALGKVEGLGVVVLPALLIMILGTIGYYFREAYRAR